MTMTAFDCQAPPGHVAGPNSQRPAGGRPRRRGRVRRLHPAPVLPRRQHVLDQPVGVVFPRHADDVAAAVTAAAEHGVPVTPRGAGTSLAGQTVGPGLILDCPRHMNRILEIDPGSRAARVQPGVVQDQLNRAAAPHGLMFGPDTSTSNRATIGGMIGNNSAGSGSIRTA